MEAAADVLLSGSPLCAGSLWRWPLLTTKAHDCSGIKCTRVSKNTMVGTNCCHKQWHIADWSTEDNRADDLNADREGTKKAKAWVATHDNYGQLFNKSQVHCNHGSQASVHRATWVLAFVWMTAWEAESEQTMPQLTRKGPLFLQTWTSPDAHTTWLVELQKQFGLNSSKCLGRTPVASFTLLSTHPQTMHAHSRRHPFREINYSLHQISTMQPTVFLHPPPPPPPQIPPLSPTVFFFLNFSI